MEEPRPMPEPRNNPGMCKEYHGDQCGWNRMNEVWDPVCRGPHSPLQALWHLVRVKWEFLGRVQTEEWYEHFRKIILVSVLGTASFFKKKKNFLIFIDERERERDKFVVLLIYLCIAWLLLVCALTRDQTDNLGVLGWCSNQLSYPARAGIASWKPSLRTRWPSGRL